MYEYEGPYSFKGVDGLKTDAYIFLPEGEKKIIGEVTARVGGDLTFDVRMDDEYTDIETFSFEVPMRFTAVHTAKVNRIEWGYNCLTHGVHHGRPEKIWNLPLLQTESMFTPVQLQQLVVNRIYNDAMQFVENSPFVQKRTEAAVVFTQKWADKIKEETAPEILPTYQKKIGEIAQYYRSASYKRDLETVIRLSHENKLNPGYEPLHPHDTINLLCRIVGQSAKFKVK